MNDSYFGDDDDDNESDDVYDIIETLFEIMDDIAEDGIDNQIFMEEVLETALELMDDLYEDEENVKLLIPIVYDLYCICMSEEVKCVEISMSDHIQFLKNKYQPDQRTPEWYTFRHNMITASNAHKGLGTQASINNLICEKCQPMKQEVASENPAMININSSLHWGQKYEPISIELYEHKFQTTIEALGCLQHDKYSFIGASPDGINVDPHSPLHGRMLEIKNVVSREITGIPKHEYWIQMQLQMEVCDLDCCDFLETKFVEYETENDYLTDTSENQKGYYILFVDKQLVPKYIYKPILLMDRDSVRQWDMDMMVKYESPPYNYRWMKRYYWKLEKLSCVLVQRNRLWFSQNVQRLQNVWNIILAEREDGSYVKRLPVKRIKQEIKSTTAEPEGLLLTVQF